MGLYFCFDVWLADEIELEGLERRAADLAKDYRSFQQNCGTGTEGGGRLLGAWLEERTSLDARVPAELGLRES